MAKNKDIEAEARVVAADFKLPGGRRKAVAKLVKDHLSWFDAAKARGMAVEDILSLLTSAGATYEDGSSINFATLSNALWRKRNNKIADTEREDREPATAAGDSPKARSRRGKKSSRGVDQSHVSAGVLKPSAKRRRASSAAPTQDDRRSAFNQTDQRNRPTNSGLQISSRPKKTPTSNADVLGFMRRAAAIRRPRSDHD